MTVDISWNNIEIKHVKPVSEINLTNDEDITEPFSWKKTKPLVKHDIYTASSNIKIRNCALHFIEAYQFLQFPKGGVFKHPSCQKRRTS